MRDIKLLDVIVSCKDRELAIKSEVAQLSSFLFSHADYRQDKILVLDKALVHAESTNSLGIRTSISYEEVAMVFYLADKIYTTLTPRIDGGYVAQQVQQEVDIALVNYDNTFLGNVCRIADLLGISFLVNACVSAIMSRPNTVEAIIFLENVDQYIPADEDLIARQLFEGDFGWFDQERILKLLKKHFLLKKNNFNELSIADYLHLHGQPEIYDFILSLHSNKITSLYGIDQIADKCSVEQLDLRNNFLAASWYDMEGVISFSGFTGLEAILLSRNAICLLPLHIFDGLNSLIHLHLDQNLLTGIEARHFQDLGNLQFLFLNDNNFETLIKPVFKNLSSLHTLGLGDNQKLHHLGGDVFQGLTALKQLRLHDTALATLPERIFCELHTLQGLSLYRNQLISLPPHLFKSLISLKMLDISDNLLTSLDSDVFYGLDNLLGLDMSGNPFEMLPETVLSTTPLLETLYMSGNQLVVLQPMFFQGLINLRLLNLGKPLCSESECDHEDICCHLLCAQPKTPVMVKSLPKHLFQGLISLESLNINNCGISDLDSDMFQGLFHLKELSLENNYFKCLPTQVFKDLVNLTYLNLSNNEVEMLDGAIFQNLGNLKTLILCNNNFKKFPEELFLNLKNLISLALENNKLIGYDVSFYRFFKGLDKIKVVLVNDDQKKIMGKTYEALLRNQFDDRVES